MALGKTVKSIQSFLSPRYSYIIKSSECSRFLRLLFCCFDFIHIYREQPFKPSITNATLDNITFVIRVTTGALQSNIFEAFSSMDLFHFFLKHAQAIRIVGIHPLGTHPFSNCRHCLHCTGRQNFLHRFSDDTGCDHAVSPFQRIAQDGSSCHGAYKAWNLGQSHFSFISPLNRFFGLHVY